MKYHRLQFVSSPLPSEAVFIAAHPSKLPFSLEVSKPQCETSPLSNPVPSLITWRTVQCMGGFDFLSPPPWLWCTWNFWAVVFVCELVPLYHSHIFSLYVLVCRGCMCSFFSVISCVRCGGLSICPSIHARIYIYICVCVCVCMSCCLSMIQYNCLCVSAFASASLCTASSPEACELCVPCLCVSRHL